MNDERLYHYYFEGITEPLTVLAVNKIKARQILENSYIPEIYRDKKLESETNSYPVPGVSHMMINGKKMIWMGRSEKNPGGWAEEQKPMLIAKLDSFR